MKKSEQQNLKSKLSTRQGLYTPELEKDSCGVGMICDLNASPSRKIVDSALTILENMDHRGAYGAETNTGDGAGILVQIPHDYFNLEFLEQGISLPSFKSYGVGMFFLPKDPAKKHLCQTIIRKHVQIFDFEILHTRAVPVDNSMIGSMALASEPDMEQWFVRPKDADSASNLEHVLFFLRSSILNDAYEQDAELIDDFYATSFSSKTIVYKGQLSATQLRSYFLDLGEETFTSAVAIVHSRFSTNTIPKWKLAQPFRCISHNGEINTIQGNINWWQAREKRLRLSDTYDAKFKNVFPICDPYISDSGNFDNVVEFLLQSGRSLPNALMMMIPEAWQNDETMPDFKKAYYQFHDGVMEPWDGPASICFTDGTIVGATLDRNGLRPSRYTLTNDDMLILGSEAGCLCVDPSTVLYKGRLQAGKMLVVDLDEKRIIADEEVKRIICNKNPYRDWIEKETVYLSAISKTAKEEEKPLEASILLRWQIAFGMTKEDSDLTIESMCLNTVEPLGSMGADIPLAILSRIAQHPSNYFKQQFAQVTNPPIDSLREAFFMSLKTQLGGTGRIITMTQDEAAVLRLDSPILLAAEYSAIKQLENPNFSFQTVSLSFSAEEGIESALTRLCNTVEAAAWTANIICLSDRQLSQSQLNLPTLLAIGAVHHFLIARGKRKKLSLIVEGGDIWETHHYATLLSYGADAIYPYLAYETCKSICRKAEKPTAEGIKAYHKAAEKGLLKIMSKLGVSTVNSYRGAQTFEALGVSPKVVNKCFKGTITRLQGIDFNGFQRELLAKHNLAFGHSQHQSLPDIGMHQWKKQGEYHLFNPKSIHLLQHSTKLGDYDTYKKFAQEIDNIAANSSTLRSFLKIKKGHSIPLSEVEPVENILKRFASGAMSFGSISHEAHTTLAMAMNRIGAKSNSGEGGEDEARFEVMKNGDSMNSAIKQVASGRFGVTINYLSNAKELQIKMAQGAKPGEGGQLPGHKVDDNIARVRHSTPGVGLISPPPHHDIYSIEDLAQLIHDLKNANRKARISVKLVSKTGVGVIASGVTKAHADHILISGWDGGTGASPLSSVKHAGLPWELGLAETHQTLVKNKLRDRVVIQSDGQMRTGRDIAIATMLGAEEWGIATAALVVEGCILMRKCHLNTCPVGIATQDPALRKKFEGKVEHLVNYFTFIAEHLRELMAECGVKTVNELVGRSDLLEIATDSRHWKSDSLDLTPLLYKFEAGSRQTLYASKMQDHNLDQVLDRKLINDTKLARDNRQQYGAIYTIKNTDRSVGTMLSNEIAKSVGSKGLKPESIDLTFVGSAGQSFAAFAAKGLKFNILGEANDYFCKGLSGATVVVKPDTDSMIKAADNLIIGNVALYGATSGEVYVSGIAGDRFAVRNSGATAVVEGIGDNGCEYMTGGTVVVLGGVGRNFAAGMSGGIAYLYNGAYIPQSYINTGMVLREETEKEDWQYLHTQIHKHWTETESELAKNILHNWEAEKHKFLKIMPIEYKAILEKNKQSLHKITA